MPAARAPTTNKQINAPQELSDGSSFVRTNTPKSTQNCQRQTPHKLRGNSTPQGALVSKRAQRTLGAQRNGARGVHDAIEALLHRPVLAHGGDQALLVRSGEVRPVDRAHPPVARQAVRVPAIQEGHMCK
eukprot:1178315-Prorocentrum_minimum.AAC.1